MGNHLTKHFCILLNLKSFVPKDSLARPGWHSRGPNLKRRGRAPAPRRPANPRVARGVPGGTIMQYLCACSRWLGCLLPRLRRAEASKAHQGGHLVLICTRLVSVDLTADRAACACTRAVTVGVAELVTP